MADDAARRGLLELARAEFLDGEPTPDGVPDHVVESWHRSRSSGVQPDDVASVYFPELDFSSRLVRCGQPVVDRLAERIADISACVALTDNQARLVARNDTNTAFGRVLDRVYFAQGFGYAEDKLGTNGVGTVLEHGQPVQIVGAEHFVDRLHAFACAGAPVHDPLTGQVEGILDISCLSEQSSPVLASLVRVAALEIERSLLLDRDLPQQALFDAYARLDARQPGAVLAVGPRVAMANPVLQALLTPADQTVLQEHLRMYAPHGRAIDARVDLPGGSTVHVRGGVVTAGTDVAGVVAVVTPVGELGPDAGRLVLDSRALPAAPAVGAGHLLPHASASAPWRAAAATADDALRRGASVLVLGDQATGRATLLADLFAELHPAGRVVLHQVDEVESAPEDVARRVLARERGPVLHVLRDVDRVLAGPAGRLAAALAGVGSGGGAVLAATATHEPDPRWRPLFDTTVRVPALRQRTDDLAALVAGLLVELGAGGTVLAPDAASLLARYAWPGNLRQLRAALVVALSHEPGGLIEGRHLPPYCQVAPRHFTRAGG